MRQSSLQSIDKRWYIFVVALLARVGMFFICGGLPIDGGQFLKAFEGAYHIQQGDGYSEHFRDLMIPFSLSQLKKMQLISYRELVEAHEEIKGPPRPLLSHPPGYSIIMWFFLALGIKSYSLMYGLQILLDSLVPVLLYQLVSSLMGRRLAFAGGIFYALYPPLAAKTVIMSMDSLLPFLAAVMIYWHARAMKARVWYLWIGVGVSAAAACYLRPNFLIYPTVVFLITFLVRKRIAAAFRDALIVAVTMVIALFPWAFYNHQRIGVWMFSTTGGGCTLCSGLGRNPNNPWGMPYTDAAHREHLERIGLERHSVEANRYYYQRFREAVISHPVAYAVVVLKRIPKVFLLNNFWGIYPAATVLGYKEYSAEHGKVLGLYYYYLANPPAVISRMVIVGKWFLEDIFLVMAYAGIWLAFRRHGRFTLVLLAPAICLALSCILVHVESRFILPGTVVYPYFACFAAVTFQEYIRSRRKQSNY